MSAKGKKVFTLGLILFLFFLWQNTEAKEKIQGEFGLGVVLFGIYGEYQFGEMVSIGAAKGGFGAEASMIFFAHSNAILSGNILLNGSNISPISLFGTGGISFAYSKDFLFNFGIGIRIKLMKMIALRAECRLWTRPSFEAYLGTFLGGVSLYFN